MNGDRVELTILSPVYRNEDSLQELIQRVASAVSRHVASWEYILVVDGSPDRSLEVLRDLAANDHRIKVVSFTRNFGQHAAMLAGMQCARGDMIFILDADLEEEPEAFSAFYEKLQEGYDLAVGIRRSPRKSLFKEWSARFYYQVQGWLTDYPLMPKATNMRLMTRKFARHLLRFSEKPFFGGFTVWVGGRIAEVPVPWIDRERRSSFGLRKLIAHSRLGVLAFSSKLLRVSSFAGVVISSGAFLFGAYLVGAYFVVGTAVPGFTSLATLMTFVLGLQCIFLGILGEYIGEIFEGVKRRPRYLVDEVINVEDPDERCVG